MDDFISGVLLKFERGAIYDDFVFDYWLHIQLSDGHKILVFDLSDRLSEGLTEGDTYRFILAPFFLSESQSADDGMNGEIVNLTWQIDPTHCKTNLTPGEDYVLVKTKYGCWLFYLSEIVRYTGENPQVGQTLSWSQAWKKDRIDLMGIAR